MVVLIHGFAEDHTVWNFQAQQLRKNFKVLAIDLPGFSEFDNVVATDISIKDCAVSLYKVLTKEKIGKCIVIGHSMGGYVALAFAEQFPQKIIGLGLVHSNAYKDDEAKMETRIKATKLMAEIGPVPFLEATTPSLFFNVPASKAAIAQLMHAAKNFKTSTLITYYNAMRLREDSTLLLKNVSVPVLFIIGKYDKTISIKTALGQSYLGPISYVNILRKSAHMGMLEEPERTTDILHNFCISI